MNNKRNTKSDQAADAETSKTENTNTDQLNSSEVLQQLMDRLDPLLKFNKPTESAGIDDVTICWNLKAIRGEDTEIFQYSGSSTLHGMLAPNMMIESPSRAEQEIREKVVRPMVGFFQGYVNQMALMEVAAKEESLDLEDLN